MNYKTHYIEKCYSSTIFSTMFTASIKSLSPWHLKGLALHEFEFTLSSEISFFISLLVILIYLLFIPFYISLSNDYDFYWKERLLLFLQLTWTEVLSCKASLSIMSNFLSKFTFSKLFTFFIEGITLTL